MNRIQPPDVSDALQPSSRPIASEATTDASPKQIANTSVPNVTQGVNFPNVAHQRPLQQCQINVQPFPEFVPNYQYSAQRNEQLYQNWYTKYMLYQFMHRLSSIPAHVNSNNSSTQSMNMADSFNSQQNQSPSPIGPTLLAGIETLQQPATNAEVEFEILHDPPAPVPEPLSPQIVADQVSNSEEIISQRIDEPTIIHSGHHDVPGRTERLGVSGVNEDRPANSFGEIVDSRRVNQDSLVEERTNGVQSDVVSTVLPGVAQPLDNNAPTTTKVSRIRKTKAQSITNAKPKRQCIKNVTGSTPTSDLECDGKMIAQVTQEPSALVPKPLTPQAVVNQVSSSEEIIPQQIQEPASSQSGHGDVTFDAPGRTKRRKSPETVEGRLAYPLRSSKARTTVKVNASGLEETVDSRHVHQDSTINCPASTTNVVQTPSQNIPTSSGGRNSSIVTNDEISGYTTISDCIIRLGNNGQNSSDDYGECECYQTGGNCSDESCVNRAMKVECPESCRAVNCKNQRIGKKMHANVYVFDTKSNKGKGLFAGEDLKPNQFIMELMGEVITKEEDKKRTQDNPGVYRYTISTVEGIIDATEYGNKARFVNHSCAPNAVCEGWIVPGTTPNFHRMALFANSNIPAGKEITFDYGPKIHEFKECLCGTPSCRYQKK